MTTLEDNIGTFSAVVEKFALTLIAKVTEIDDSLSRIASDTELLSKIKSQLAANMKQSQTIERQITVLNNRLDAMGISSLNLITAPTDSASTLELQKVPLQSQPAAPKMDEDLLSMPAPLSPPENQGEGKELVTESVHDEIPTPPVVPSKLSLTTLPEKPQPPAIETVLPPISDPTPPQKFSPTFTPLPEKPSLTFTLPPEKPTPATIPSESGLPVLHINDRNDPISMVLQNLSKEINELSSGEEIGKAFLMAKEAITVYIKFHPALFDLIKIGNDYIRKKSDVNDNFRAEVQKKVEEIYHKFGGR